MQTRDTRYELRFEKGRRRGERLSLAPGEHTLGRAKDNTIVVHDASVSSHHAKLLVAEDEVRVVDLQSTNGTHVGGRRIESQRLAHGDRLLFGAVELALLDAAFGTSDEAHPVALAAHEAPAPGRRRTSGLVLAALLLLALAGLWYQRFHGRRDAPAEPTVRAVVPVEGNLLRAGSFEDDDAPEWQAAAAAPRAFRRASRFAATGTTGLGAELAVDEWSLVRSEPFPLAGVRALRIRASVRALETAGAAAVGSARIGLERSDGTGRTLITWSPPVTNGEGFEAIDLLVPCAPGWESGAVVVAGRGPGEFAVDDVSAVGVPAPAPVASFLENDAHAAPGEPTSVAVLRGGRVLCEAALAGWGARALRGDGTGSLDVRALANGFRFAVRDAGEDASVLFDLDLAGEDPWVVTLGTEGFRRHSRELAVAGATDVVVGAGIQTARIRFDAPHEVRGRRLGQRLQLTVPVRTEDAFDLQLRFRAEVTEAELLRDRALAAAEDGRPADALRRWSELLERVPFRGELVREAEASRARLVQAGLESLEEIRRDVQSARFFSLPDLFRGARERAAAIVAAYGGTEVELAARELVAEVSDELRAADVERARRERRRLETLLDSQLVQRSAALSERVRRALDDLGADG